MFLSMLNRFIDLFVPDQMRADIGKEKRARMFLISHFMGPILQSSNYRLSFAQRPAALSPCLYSGTFDHIVLGIPDFPENLADAL